MDEQQHQKVTNAVAADRKKPPDFNLLGIDHCKKGTGNNCQEWAQKIENLAKGL